MAGAGLFCEKVLLAGCSWLLVADSFGEKSKALLAGG
jgi:hypothetical protein